MLKSIVVSTPGARFAAYALKEELPISLKKVSELGYDAVELAIRDPKLVAPNKLRELLNLYKLQVSAIGTGQAYGEEGLSFTSPELQIRSKAIHRLKEQLDLAQALNGQPQVLFGLLRGSVNQDEFQKVEENLIVSLRECLDYQPEIIIAIEPINRYETNLYNDIRSTIDLIEKVARPNLKMLIDTFHMNIEESDICQAVLEGGSYISHVHFADSNRHAPGCGHIDFKSVVDALKQIGYKGAISAEILPLPSPEESLKLTIDYYNKLGI